MCVYVCIYTVGLDQSRSMQQMTSASFVVVNIDIERERKRKKQRDYQR